VSPPKCPTHLTQLSVCLSILCLFWISSCPQLSPVRSSNNQGAREKTLLQQQGRERKKQRPFKEELSNLLLDAPILEEKSLWYWPTLDGLVPVWRKKAKVRTCIVKGYATHSSYQAGGGRKLSTWSSPGYMDDPAPLPSALHGSVFSSGGNMQWHFKECRNLLIMYCEIRGSVKYSIST
jgi:hypothetical protein